MPGELRLPYIERNTMYCLMLLAILPLVNYISIVLFPQKYMNQRLRDINTVVILGHHLKKGDLSGDGKYRLEEALSILRRFSYKPSILLSGANGEAEKMKDYLEKYISGYDIVCESDSKTTVQNLLYSSDVFGDKTVVISSAYRLFRVQMLLDKNQKTAILVPARSDKFLSECAKECYKYIFDYVRVRRIK